MWWEKYRKILDLLSEILGSEFVQALLKVGLPLGGIKLLASVFYLFWKRYFSENDTFMGLTEEKIREDLILTDIALRKTEAEKRKAEEREKMCTDEASKIQKGHPEAELLKWEALYEQLRGRFEFDKYVLEVLRCKKVLTDRGAWEELEKAAKETDKKIKEELKEREKTIKDRVTGLDFKVYAALMRELLNEICGKN